MTTSLGVVTHSTENLDCGREQRYLPQLVLAAFSQSTLNGFDSCIGISSGKLKEGKAGLTPGATGLGMAKGPLRYFKLTMNQVDHAQLIVCSPGVEEINRLNLRTASERLR